jgi:hypothetical protein
MIALALDVRPVESSFWLELVGHRFNRFDSVKLNETQFIVHMPRVGSILVDRTTSALRFQAMVRDERHALAVQSEIAQEIAAAVPESVGGGRLTLEWSRPSVVPVPLR